MNMIINLKIQPVLKKFARYLNTDVLQFILGLLKHIAGGLDFVITIIIFIIINHY